MSRKPKILLSTNKFQVVEHVVPDFCGREPIKRQIIEHPGAVTILPLLPDDQICLIRNERIAVGKSLIELPAGTIDPLEPPAETAARELKEETGYTSKTWRELPSFFMSPGILNERMYLFVADSLVAGTPAREAGEEIENVIVPWTDAVRMAEQGEIQDAKSLVGILLWDRLRQ